MAVTAEQQTQLVQLVVGMAGVAPAAATLETAIWLYEGNGMSMAALADQIADHPAFSSNAGLYPAYLPNEVFADQWMTNFLGGETTAEVLAAAIAQMTADLNGGMTRGAAMLGAIDALVADPTPTGYEDAAAALANLTEVAEYYATTSTDEENLAMMADAVDGVTSDVATVATAKAAIDAGVVPPEFDLNAGFDGIAAAEDAISDFLAAEETTIADIATDLGAAIVAYDAALNDADILGAAASDYANDTQASRDALLSSGQSIAAANLANAQAGLATANAAVDAVAGLTDAVAAATAAAAAVTSSTAAEAATTVEVGATVAAWLVTGAAATGVAAVSDAGAGVYDFTGDGTASDPFAGATVDLTEANLDGTISLADANPLWTATQVAFFQAQQALVADVLAAYNVDEAAEDALAAATASATAANYTVGFLDLDPAASASLIAVGQGFTLTTKPAATVAPSEAQITAESAALAAAESAATAVKAGTAAALTAANAAATVANTNVTNAGTALTTAVDAADDSGTIIYDGAAATINANSIVVAADGSATANAGAVNLIVVGAGGLELGAGIANDVGGTIAALLLASQSKEAADAAKVVADTVAADALTADVAAGTALTNATTAETTFNGLITTFDGLNVLTPRTTALTAPTTAVSDAEDDAEAIADALADLTATGANSVTLAALQAALGDAQDAFTDEGYSLPEDVDAAAEFATAADDIFRAVSTDSTVYNFNLQGDDTLYIGADITHNTTEIGTGTGQTALSAAGDDDVVEVFLQESGADTIVHIEDADFGSAGGLDNVTSITLVGVDIDDVTIANGFLTVA